MRKSKVTAEGLCKVYNTFRQQRVGQKLVGEQLMNLLHKEGGISKWIVNKMLQNPTFFTKVKREGKKCTGYMFQYNPVNIHLFETWLKDQKSVPPKKEEKKELSFEEECVQYLNNICIKGTNIKKYKIEMCLSFDEEALGKDYPQLYQKYLRYEKV
jgi:hypothetical protein